MKFKSDGSVLYETREELIETAHRCGFGLYMVRYHRDLKELALDLEARGVPMRVLPQYFDFVVFPDGRIIEIIGHEGSTGELLTNTVFGAKGDEEHSGRNEGLTMCGIHKPKN